MNSKYSIDFGSYFDKAPVVEEQPKQTGIVAPRTKDIKAPTDDGYKPDAFVSDYMKILAEYAGGEDKARELLGRTASTYDPMATLDKFGEPFDMAQAAQDDAFKWSAARDAAGITQSLPTPGFEMRMGEAGVLPSVSGVDTAELPARVAPVGREDTLKGAGLMSPMGGPNRGSVRPAAEETPDISTSVEAAVAEALGGTEEATTGEGLMSRRLDSKGETPLKRYTDNMFTTNGSTVTPNMKSIKDYAKDTFSNPVAAAAFAATVEAESGTDLVEGGYSKKRAIEVFVNRNKRKDGTLGPKMLARKQAIEALPEDYTGDDIFNIVYGGRMGNTAPGDGSKYKGRGLIMITGKDRYKSLGDAIGVDLVKNPELLETDKDVMLKATIQYLNDKGFGTKNLTQAGLASIIGHSDNGGAEAKRRWNNAKKYYKDMYGKDMPVDSRSADTNVETSLRPKARPEKATE